MPVVAFSPHTDDAIFSIGGTLGWMTEVTIVSPMAAVPADEAGRAKHERLRAEHGHACEILDAEHVEGPFLDDVYPPSLRRDVLTWLASFLVPGVTAFVPLGIHHPDHVFVSDLIIALLPDRVCDDVFFYEELPYRVDHPHLVPVRVDHVAANGWPLQRVSVPSYHPLKAAAVMAYQSQVDDDVLNRVLVDEHVWGRA